MASLEVIKYDCLKTISIFLSQVRNHRGKEISKSFIFVPQFIHEDQQSYLFIRNNPRLLLFYVLFKKKTTLNGLTKIIYCHQNDISWVDFRLCKYNSILSIFVVELVCMNKKNDDLNYHLYWPISIDL